MTKSAISWDLVKFTEENLNGKLHFLCNESAQSDSIKGELEGAPYLATEGAPKISLYRAVK